MKRLTNSEMKTWRRDKRQWYLGYYLGYHRANVAFNNALSIGTRVHDCLAMYYNPTERIEPLTYLDLTVAADIEARPAQETDILKEADLCRAMLEGYVQWTQETGVDEGYKLIAAEGAREVPLAGPDHPFIEGVTLLSKLDARVIREFDGARLALEHKTVGDFSTPTRVLQLDTQVLTEQLVEMMALHAEGKDELAAKGVLYNMLRKVKRTVRAKPPFYQRETALHSKEELRNHWKHVVAMAYEIRTAEIRLDEGADHHFICPPNPTRDSAWDNEFFPIYGLMDDGSDWVAAMEGNYIKGDPLERYAGLTAAETNSDGVGLAA